MDSPKTCADCGKSPIPDREVVYSGSNIICHRCYLGPPRQITMYNFAPGHVWHNQASGGKEVQYVRADLVDTLMTAVRSVMMPRSYFHKRVRAALNDLAKIRPAKPIDGVSTMADESVDELEHPEDRQNRIESEAYGKKHAPEFVGEFKDEIVLLISTYSDVEALELLETLRERFWAQEWKPRGQSL